MKKLSQRTLVIMADALRTVPQHERYRLLLEYEFPIWFANDAARRYAFNWLKILVDLRETSFVTSTHSSYNRGFAVTIASPAEAQEVCEDQIRKLAAIAASLPDGKPVENSLQLDGYGVDKERLILVPLEGPVSAEAEEDVIIALLRQSGIPNAATVAKHIADANSLFVDGKYGPSLGQSRNVLQALIDDISTETDQNGNHATNLPGGTGNRIKYLMEVGFFTADEQAAFGSAWGALSAGSHPGVPAREEARIGLILALEFGQLLLLKWANWSKSGYRAFSP